MGDTLWIHISPDRPVLEVMTEYDFYISYDQDNLNEIVGYKILDFSHYIFEPIEHELHFLFLNLGEQHPNKN